MKYLAAIILIGFAAISFFGFAYMAHNGNHEADNCIASVLGKTDCPPNALVMASIHFAAYQVFSQAAPFLFFIFVSLILSLFAAVFLSGNFSPGNAAALSLRKSAFAGEGGEPPSHQLSKITHWLSLLENSPSYR